MAGQQDVQVDEKAVLEIVSSKNIHIYFQPVVSISTKSIVGFEAFARGGSADACVLDPAMLFHDGLKPELKIDVDRLCREKAFDQFKPIVGGHKDMLLFVNVNPDILAHVEVGSEVLKKQLAATGVHPRNVVVECPLCRSNTDEIEAFAKLYKEFGFQICLDNCHVDDPFSQAVSRIQPHFVKINRSFFGEEERTRYSSDTLERVQNVADRFGSLVVAQGVESEDDSIRLLTAGVHLQQGYYYTKDESATSGDPAKVFIKKIIDTYEKYKKVKRELVKRKKERLDTAFKGVSSACSKLAAMPETRFEDACKTLVRNVDSVISIFVLDEIGEQITTRAHVRPVEGKSASPKVLGFEIGVDHSIKDYVLYLDMNYEKFVTKPFISPYTGEKSCIISRPFYNNEGLRYILCVEMPHPG